MEESDPSASKMFCAREEEETGRWLQGQQASSKAYFVQMRKLCPFLEALYCSGGSIYWWTVELGSIQPAQWQRGDREGWRRKQRGGDSRAQMRAPALAGLFPPKAT